MAFPKRIDDEDEIVEEEGVKEPEPEDAEGELVEEEEEVPERPRARKPAKRASSRAGGFGRRRSSGGGRRKKESAFVRVCGLFENRNGSLSGAVYEEKEEETDWGTLVLPEGQRFIVMENAYAKSRKDPPYVLLAPKEDTRER